MQQPFARERTHAKQVLVHIRRAIAVRVNTALARKHSVKRCALFRLRQRRDDTRLQNAVARCHAPAGCIHVRRIQWVRGYRHQLAQGRGRQAGVAVQRHDVLNAAGQLHTVGNVKSFFAACALVVARSQQANECFELAALALPADPLALGAAPFAAPVDEQKARGLVIARGIFSVQGSHLRQRFFE